MMVTVWAITCELHVSQCLENKFFYFMIYEVTRKLFIKLRNAFKVKFIP